MKKISPENDTLMSDSDKDKEPGLLQAISEVIVANRRWVFTIVAIFLIDTLLPSPEIASEWLVYQAIMVTMFMAFNAIVLGALIAFTLMVIRQRIGTTALIAEVFGAGLRAWALAAILILLPTMIIKATADSLYETYQSHPEILLGLFIGFVICSISMLCGAIYWLGTRSIVKVVDLVTEVISPVDTSEKAINTKNIPRVEDTNDDKTGIT